MNGARRLLLPLSILPVLLAPRLAHADGLKALAMLFQGWMVVALLGPLGLIIATYARMPILGVFSALLTALAAFGLSLVSTGSAAAALALLVVAIALAWQLGDPARRGHSMSIKMPPPPKRRPLRGTLDYQRAQREKAEGMPPSSEHDR